MGYSEICLWIARREESLQWSLHDLSSASFSAWLIFHLASLLASTKIATVAHSNRKTRTTQADISVKKSESKWSQITLCILTNVLTSIAERFCANFEQINIPLRHIGNRTCLGFKVPLIWCVKSNWPISVNTQIVQVPLQALFSHARPLAIRKQISE